MSNSDDRRARIFFSLLFASAIFLAACGNPAPAAKRFHLKGKIVSLDAANNSLTIDHEDIPGFMGAMTMPYFVRSASALAGLGPGDEITADVVVPDAGATYVENIVVSKKAGPSAPPPSGALLHSAPEINSLQSPRAST